MSGKFEPLDESIVGPKMVLVCGYAPNELGRIKRLLAEFGVDVKEFCKEMLKVTVEEALVMECEGFFDEKLPRVVLFSGMGGKDVSRAIDLIRKLGVKPPIFAVTTKINLKMTLGVLLKELIREYLEFANRDREGN